MHVPLLCMKKQKHAYVTVSMLAYGDFRAWNLFSPSQLGLEKHSNRNRQTASSAFTNTLNSLTVASFPLEVDMAPLAIIQSLVTGFHLDAARAHIHDQVEKSIQKLNGEEVSPGLPVGLRTLKAAMAEQQQAAGLCGAEVKRYGARLLCVPPGQCQEGKRCVEGDGLQGLHVLAAEDQVTMDTDLRVPLFSQPRQFQSKLIILVDHLINERDVVVR